MINKKKVAFQSWTRLVFTNFLTKKALLSDFLDLGLILVNLKKLLSYIQSPSFCEIGLLSQPFYMTVFNIIYLSINTMPLKIQTSRNVMNVFHTNHLNVPAVASLRLLCCNYCCLIMLWANGPHPVVP